MSDYHEHQSYAHDHEAPEGPENSDPAGYRRNARGVPVKSVEHTLEAVTAIVRGLGRRRRRPDAGANDDLDLAELDQLLALRSAVDAEIDQAVTDLATVKGYTWGEIGRHLGVTRQAARQRWGAAALEPLERAPLEGRARQ